MSSLAHRAGFAAPLELAANTPAPERASSVPTLGAAGLEPEGAELRDPADNRLTIQRPPSGLARGRWEAPAAVFWVLVVLALVVGAAWAATSMRRAGWLTVGGRRPSKRP